MVLTCRKHLPPRQISFRILHHVHGWCMDIVQESNVRLSEAIKVGIVGVLSSVQVDVGLDTCDERETAEDDEQEESEESERTRGRP